MVKRLSKRNIHQSWLIAVACCGIVIGVIIAPYVSDEIFRSIAWGLTGLSLVVFGMVRAKVWTISIVLLGGSLMGIWRGDIALADDAAHMSYIGSVRIVSGVVSEDTNLNARSQTVVRLKDVSIDGVKSSISMWVTVTRTDKIKRSDILTVQGKLQSGFGSFRAAIYDATIRHIERPEPGDIALRVRDWFAGGVQNAVSEPESSLGLGYLLGQRRGLPEELDTALKAAGLTHIVVASGYNLTILVRFARRLFEKISKFLSFFSSSAMIVGFVAITGLSPSMSRAGLVAGLSLLAWYYGRRFHPLVLLPFAAAVTVLVQPNYAWGDLGWQLSFAAFGGVMILAPLLSAYFYGDVKENAIRRIFIETISAQIVTLPIILLAFGQMSVVAPIANILILPLVPLAMVLTFVAGIGGLVLPTLATIVGFPAEIVLTYMTATAQYVGGLSWALADVAITPFIAAGMYGLIILFALYAWWTTRFDLAKTSLVE